MNDQGISAKCIHCHSCRDNCIFLGKYGIDIGDKLRLEELAYHCFLCGDCTQVCPEEIDGRQLILNIRRKQVDACDGKLPERGYGMLLAEKKNYRFRNYRKAKGKSVFFPGCNLPSFYPAVTKRLVQVLKEKADIGVVYDCCGKPVAELGMKAQEEQIAEQLKAALEKNGVEEVITACPNCYHFLREKLDVHVTDIYTKLDELGIGRSIPGGCRIFLPCPDKAEKKILKSLGVFLQEPCDVLQSVQCCGLGGCASVKEPELAHRLAELAAGEPGQMIYAYCASCCGNLKKNGCRNVIHPLAAILGMHEEPDTGKSMLNRMMTKFR